MTEQEAADAAGLQSYIGAKPSDPAAVTQGPIAPPPPPAPNQPPPSPVPSTALTGVNVPTAEQEMTPTDVAQLQDYLHLTPGGQQPSSGPPPPSPMVDVTQKLPEFEPALPGVKGTEVVHPAPPVGVPMPGAPGQEVPSIQLAGATKLGPMTEFDTMSKLGDYIASTEEQRNLENIQTARELAGAYARGELNLPPEWLHNVVQTVAASQPSSYQVMREAGKSIWDMTGLPQLKSDYQNAGLGAALYNFGVGTADLVGGMLGQGAHLASLPFRAPYEDIKGALTGHPERTGAAEIVGLEKAAQGFAPLPGDISQFLEGLTPGGVNPDTMMRTLRMRNLAARAEAGTERWLSYDPKAAPATEELTSFAAQTLPYALLGELPGVSLLSDAAGRLAARILEPVVSRAVPLAVGVDRALGQFAARRLTPLAQEAAVQGTKAAGGYFLGEQFGHGWVGAAISGLLGARGTIRSIVDAFTAAPVDAVDKVGPYLVQSGKQGRPFFFSMRDGLEKDMTRLARQRAMIEDGADEITKTKALMPDGTRVFSTDELKNNLAKVMDAQEAQAAKWRRLNNYGKAEKITTDAIINGGAALARSTPNGLVLGGINALSAPSPDQAGPAFKQGFEMGVVLDLPISMGAMSQVARENAVRNLNRLADVNAIRPDHADYGIDRAERLKMLWSDPGKLALNVIRQLAGLAAPLKVPVVVLPKEEFLARTPGGEPAAAPAAAVPGAPAPAAAPELVTAQPGRAAPNAYYDSASKQIYYNSSAPVDSVGHELSEAYLQALGDNGVASRLRDAITNPAEQPYVQRFLQTYMDLMRKSNPNFATLTPDDLVREMFAELGRDVLRKVPPAVLYGGRSGAQILGDAANRLINKIRGVPEDTKIIPGGLGAPEFPGTRDMMLDLLFGLGERAKYNIPYERTPGMPPGFKGPGPVIAPPPTPPTPPVTPLSDEHQAMVDDLVKAGKVMNKPWITPEAAEQAVRDAIATGQPFKTEDVLNTLLHPPKPAPGPGPIVIPNHQQILADAEARVRARKGFKRMANEGADAIRAAQVEDLAKAHAAAAGPDTDLITWREDKHGKTGIWGTRADPDDPLLKAILGHLNLPEWAIENLNNYEAAMKNGDTITINYSHAPGQPEDTTKQAREAARKAATPADRWAGNVPREKRTKTFIPTGFRYFPDGNSLEVQGISPDKFFENANYLINWLKKNQPNTPTFDSVNDPKLIDKFREWTDNILHGYTGEGKEIVGATDIKGKPIKPDLNYPAKNINEEITDPETGRKRVVNYVDQISLMMGNTGARTPVGLQEQVRKGELTPKQAEAKKSKTLKYKQQLAEDNSPFWEAKTGETNPIRKAMGADAAGIHSVHELLWPELTDSVREGGQINDAQTMHPSGFTGDRAKLGLSGIPKEEFVAGSFMPATEGYTPEFRQPQPADDDTIRAALQSNKAPLVGAHRNLQPGTPISVRIDIPSFLRSGIYAQTVHQPKIGKALGYDSIVHLDKPVSFTVRESTALKIKNKEINKAPIAAVEGRYNPNRTVPPDINDTSKWTPLGFDPMEHSYFYDKTAEEKPVIGGDEAIHIGNTVYVKNPVYGKASDFTYMPHTPAAGPAPEMVQTKQDKASGYVPITVDIAALDAAHASAHPDKHVGPGGEGGIKGRYPAFEKFLKSGKPVEMPTMGLDRNGDPQFENGRHRFAVLRDQGAKTTQVSVPKDQAAEFQKLFSPREPRPLSFEEYRAAMIQAIPKWNRTAEQQKLLDAFNARGKEPGVSYMPAATQTETPEFTRWFRDSKAVDEHGEPLVLYHGSTHDFRAFDPSLANPENDWGKGIYLTNEPSDVSVNYAGEGPDLTNRIENLTQRIMGDRGEEFRKLARSDPQERDPIDLAEEEARRALGIQHGGAVYPVYAKMENPLELGGKNDPHWTYEYDEDTGHESGDLVALHNALMSAAAPYHDADAQRAFNDAMDKVGYDGKASDYVKALRDSEGLAYATDEHGNIAGKEIIRDALERMGFDGIIDHEVHEKFPRMEGMGPGTSHYVAFEPTQVKSAIGNRGTFAPSEADITYMPPTAEEGRHEISEPESMGYHHGQTDLTIRAHDSSGRQVGYLDYTDYNGEPSIRMLEVNPDSRRQGVATELMNKLQDQYPDQQIKTGYASPEGRKFLEAYGAQFMSPEAHETLIDPTKKLDLEKDDHWDAVNFVAPVKGSADQFTVVDSSGNRWTGPLVDPDVVSYMPATIASVHDDDFTQYRSDLKKQLLDPAQYIEKYLPPDYKSLSPKDQKAAMKKAKSSAQQEADFWSTKDLIFVGNVKRDSPMFGQMDKYYIPDELLGAGNDPKTVKGEKWSNFRTFIMYMAAHMASGVKNFCAHAVPSCIAGCLGLGGQGGSVKNRLARANKAKYFFYEPDRFISQAIQQIGKEKEQAAKDGKDYAIRLNGTTDERWEKLGVIQAHPDVQFYDYTKFPPFQRTNLPENYNLTYSFTGTERSKQWSKDWNERGVNTAVVFRGGMPATFEGRPVIDGDVSDLRFLDPNSKTMKDGEGVVVGLHAKGKLLDKDPKTGQYKTQDVFVYDTPPEDVAIPYLYPTVKARLMKEAGSAAVDAIADQDPEYPKLIKLLNIVAKERTAAQQRILDTNPKGQYLAKVWDHAAEEEVNKVKDNIHPDFPNIAPKAGDLKYFRGNHFLDPEATGKQTHFPEKGFEKGGVVQGYEDGGVVEDDESSKDSEPGVFLIRHGCTKLNGESKQSPDLIRGHADIPLDEKGHKQAEQLGKKLAGKGIQAVFSSDLSRAMHTAAPIAKANGAPLIPAYGLRPWDLGKHQGKPSKDVQPEIDRLIDNPDERAEGGESANEFKNRFLSTMRHIVGSSQGKKIAVVTHYRGTKLLGSLNENGEVDPKEFKRKEGALEPAGVQFLSLEGKKAPMKGIS